MSGRDMRTEWAALALALMAAIGGCSKTNQQSGESNTNWLRICTGDAECGGELGCVCGTCTVVCEQAAQCSERDEATTCMPAADSCGGPARVSACLVQCTSDDECGGIEQGVCRSGVCARRVAQACPAFAAGVQTPVEVASSFEALPGVGQIGAALVDEDGFYYFDLEGALFALPHGAESPVTLRPAPEEELLTMSMVGDSTTLYWTAARRPPLGPPDPSPPPPPYWLYAISKQGGAATLLFESADRGLYALATSGDEVIVRRSSGQPTLEALAKDGSTSPRAIAEGIPAEEARVIEGELYWTVPWEESSDENGYFQDLYRAELDGSGVELLTRIENSRYIAGGGRVLWRQERTHFDPLVHDENYVMLDERTGCVQPLPALGLSISGDSLLDGRHVYWKSFNGLEAVSAGDELKAYPLVRVDLRSGVLEQIVAPGFAATLVDDIIGQTDHALYFRVNRGGAVALKKP